MPYNPTQRNETKQSHNDINMILTLATRRMKYVKVTKSTELWNAKYAWYSPGATRRICLYALK